MKRLLAGNGGGGGVDRPLHAVGKGSKCFPEHCMQRVALKLRIKKIQHKHVDLIQRFDRFETEEHA